MTGWEPLAEDELLRHAPSLADCWDELQPKLPSDRRWFSGRLDEEALSAVAHTPCEAFRILSSGTGDLRATVERLASDEDFAAEAAEPARWIRELAEGFDAAKLGTLALGVNDLEQGPFMLLDGNHRASALLLRRWRVPDSPRVDVPVVVALSARPLNPW